MSVSKLDLSPLFGAILDTYYPKDEHGLRKLRKPQPPLVHAYHCPVHGIFTALAIDIFGRPIVLFGEPSEVQCPARIPLTCPVDAGRDREGNIVIEMDRPCNRSSPLVDSTEVAPPAPTA